ncbi:unnamed protein product [Dovyalis caffra]|uniref:Uncharacterized protein n=1 Tax=Dovyalis caffra TaxID=77055 RepID=A0AAV1RJR2_9ROSI|nr:unnamed protein product [Dovyalis caffra]
MESVNCNYTKVIKGQEGIKVRFVEDYLEIGNLEYIPTCTKGVVFDKVSSYYSYYKNSIQEITLDEDQEIIKLFLENNDLFPKIARINPSFLGDDDDKSVRDGIGVIGEKGEN